MIRIRDIKLPAGSAPGELIRKCADILCLDEIYKKDVYPDFSYELLRRSIDARKKPDIFIVYTVKILISEEDEKHILKFFHDNVRKARIKKALGQIITEPLSEYTIPECGGENMVLPPVVVGTGPAGLFCSLALARRGFCPVVIERGECVEDREETVKRFWDTGELSAESNVQFGEGGAGTFSDGKLNTLTKDRNGINTFVLKTLYEHGAPKDITVDAKPHIGTDILKSVVKNIREEIISLGGTFLFCTKLTDIKTEGGKLCGITVTDTASGDVRDIATDICVLCPGHSARDTFGMLLERGVKMSPKSFAVGFRVIHSQKDVNMWQYGIEDPAEAGLPAADYKVTNETGNGRRVYSFCMCPGGYVVNASSEKNELCVNGMSESARDGIYANSAIIAAVDPDDFIQDAVAIDHPLAGMYYQRRLEEEAFERADGSIPVQTFTDFEKGVRSVDEDERLVGVAKDGVKGRVRGADLRGIFTEEIDRAVTESMHAFGRRMEGFDSTAVMAGIESRTSSPVRIERNDDCESCIRGLYPCGEGAGYAGGITSAAADGLKCAAKIIGKYVFTGNPAQQTTTDKSPDRLQ